MMTKGEERTDRTDQDRGLTDALLESILPKRPALQKVLGSYGDDSIVEYSSKLYEKGRSVSEALRGVVSEITAPVLGDEIAEKTATQLESCPTVITADHHGLLSHPLLVNGNLLGAAGAFGQGLRISPVFAVTNIPLNNKTYPRGIIWDGANIPLFPDSKKKRAVYNCPPFTLEYFDRAIQKGALKQFASDVEVLNQLEGSDIALRELFLLDSLEKQVTYLNHKLWKSAFEGVEGAPELVYLPMEQITVKLLQQSLESNDEIASFLLDPEVREKALEQFSGIYGAWKYPEGEKIKSGTQFFWGLDGKGVLRELVVDGEYLKGRKVEDIHLTKDGITTALSEGRIMPGLLLSFHILMKHGVRCLGGFNQTDYLRKMHTSICGLLEELGYDKEREELSEIDPGGYNVGPLLLTTTAPSGEVKPGGIATLLGSPEVAKKLIERLGKLTLREANALGLVEQLPIIVPSDQIPEELQELKLGDVARELGLSDNPI